MTGFVVLGHIFTVAEGELESLVLDLEKTRRQKHSWQSMASGSWTYILDYYRCVRCDRHRQWLLFHTMSGFMSTRRAQEDTLSHLQIKGLTYKCRSLDMCSKEAFKSKESRCPTCAALLFGTRTCKRFRHTFKRIKHMPLYYFSHFPLNTHTHAVPFIKKVQNWWDFI